MKVLFLNPPYLENYSRTQRSPQVTKSGTFYYPIWLAYAATTVEEAGHEMRLVDAPAERLSLLVSVDALGPWAFHCHILYHMDLGMFRVAMVQRPDDWDPEVLASLSPDGPPRRDLARG